MAAKKSVEKPWVGITLAAIVLVFFIGVYSGQPVETPGVHSGQSTGINPGIVANVSIELVAMSVGEGDDPTAIETMYGGENLTLSVSGSYFSSEEIDANKLNASTVIMIISAGLGTFDGVDTFTATTDPAATAAVVGTIRVQQWGVESNPKSLGVYPSWCGDGIIQDSPTNAEGITEECDDGNTADGDGCSSICEPEDTDPPVILSTEPSGTVTDNNITLITETDENATCRWSPSTDSNDGYHNYPSLPDYQMTGTGTTHSYHLGVLQDQPWINLFSSCMDTAGNAMTTSAQHLFTIDTTPPIVPTGLTISINGGTYTTTRSVTLTLDATDADECRYKNSGGNWGSWEVFSTSKSPWTLTTGHGIKTVYYMCRTFAGTESTEVFDSINYVQCTSGVCCNTATHTYRLNSHVCSNSCQSGTFSCSSTCGPGTYSCTTSWRKCTGISTGCTGATGTGSGGGSFNSNSKCTTAGVGSCNNCGCVGGCPSGWVCHGTSPGKCCIKTF